MLTSNLLSDIGAKECSFLVTGIGCRSWNWHSIASFFCIVFTITVPKVSSRRVPTSPTKQLLWCLELVIALPLQADTSTLSFDWSTRPLLHGPFPCEVAKNHSAFILVVTKIQYIVPILYCNAAPSELENNIISFRCDLAGSNFFQKGNEKS